MLPVRQQKNNKAKQKASQSNTLESPSLAHFELLAKRYGIKPERVHGAKDLPEYSSSTAKNLVKRLPPAVHFHETSN